jgi:hypothetical protein
MRTDEVFQSNSKNLAAKDLQGKRVTVEIAGYEIKKFDNGSKPILSFVGKDKTLVLNKTNAFSIEMVLGTKEMDEWVGRRITLRPDRTLFEGQMVACIRVDESAPAPLNPKAPVRKPAPEPELEDEDSEVPF